MERALEERKPGREGGGHRRVIKERQNRLARTFALEEEHDFAHREKDLPAIDELGEDRLDTVGEELRCVFALTGLQASYKNDPIDSAHVGQSRRQNFIVRHVFGSAVASCSAPGGLAQPQRRLHAHAWLETRRERRAQTAYADDEVEDERRHVPREADGERQDDQRDRDGDV